MDGGRQSVPDEVPLDETTAEVEYRRDPDPMAYLLPVLIFLLVLAFVVLARVL